MSGDLILALAEHDGDRLDPSSEAALTVARDLAESLGLPVAAVLIGDGADTAAQAVGRYGVAVAHVADGPGLEPYAPGAWVAVLSRLVADLTPKAVIGPGTTRGHEMLAGAAARRSAPFAAACVDIRPGPVIQVTRQRWAGSVLEDAEVHGDLVFLAVADHAVEPKPAPEPASVRIEMHEPAVADADRRVRLVERVAPTPGRISLADAKVVVGGGRGVGGPEGFAALEELATLLGGTIGVSRVVTSAGWRPHGDQVGQTGTRIAPDLYIACGISGAIQHIVGCRSAKAILAINTDPEAPIMGRATWAVIGDLHAVLPAITAEVRRRQEALG